MVEKPVPPTKVGAVGSDAVWRALGSQRLYRALTLTGPLACRAVEGMVSLPSMRSWFLPLSSRRSGLVARMCVLIKAF